MQLGAIDTSLRTSDIYYNNTSLLLHGNGSDNSTTIVDSSLLANVFTASTNAKISTAQSKFGGSSIDLSVLGSTVSCPVSTGFQFGTGDFTVELWMYFIASATESRIISFGGTTLTNARLNLSYKNSSNRLTIANEGVSHIVTSTQDLIPNTWQHIAYTREGSTLKLFFNGTLIGSASASSINSSAPMSVQIGDSVMRAYYNEVCIIKGAARYTANFTPRNRPFFDAALPAEDPSFSSVSLLMHMDGVNASTSFVDSSDSGLNLTANGNAQLSTALSKFGGASALFDGTGDFLSRAYDAKFDLVLSDFTIEAWIRPTSWKTSGTRFVSTGGGSAGWSGTTGIHVLFQFDSVGRINLQLSNNTATPISVVGTASAAINVWSHVAVSVSGSTAYLAVDGVVSSHALAARARPTTNPQIAVATIPGEAGTATYAFAGNIDELRITKDVARYTASFTPPAGPFPSF